MRPDAQEDAELRHTPGEHHDHPSSQIAVSSCRPRDAGVRLLATDPAVTVSVTVAASVCGSGLDGQSRRVLTDVVDRALSAAMQGAPDDRAAWPVIYLSPRGRPFDQATARRLAAGQGVTLLCGRCEGVDQRVLDARAIEEVSLGDFVLTGGEIAAQALLDAVVRLLPGVLGNADSAVEESFSDGLLEHPQYTRPAVWQGREIPEVLTGGNHAEVAKWRRAQAEALTAERRPDLWAAHQASHPPPPGRKARKG